MVFIKAGKKVIYTTKKGITISTPKKGKKKGKKS